MIDVNARAKLQNLQTTKAISEGIDKITNAIRETSVIASKQQIKTPVIIPKQQIKTPADDVADELRNLQKIIGGGNLTESLSKVSTSLDGFDINKNALGQLKTLVADLSAKLRLLAEIEAKLPKQIAFNFPKEVPVTGTVDIREIASLPPIRITNLDEVGKAVGMLINNLQVATIKAIQASKTQFPSSMNVGNEIKIVDFSDLLDGIEELKKGFNILINKEAATVAFPTTSIPVEIQNWKVANPVTNVSINPSRGQIKDTAVTVTTSLTPLPSTPLNARRSITIYNNGSVSVFVGGANVTAASGIPVPASTYGPSLDIGERAILYAVTASSTADIRVLEINDELAGPDN